MSDKKTPVYVYPIPYIDAGKEFEMRLTVKFEEVIELDEAKRIVAEHIKSLPVETIMRSLSCAKIKPVYPEKD